VLTFPGKFGAQGEGLAPDAVCGGLNAAPERMNLGAQAIKLGIADVSKMG